MCVCVCVRESEGGVMERVAGQGRGEGGVQCLGGRHNA